MTAAMNIRARIVLTPGICAALIVTLSIISVRGLSILGSNMQAIYAQDTVAVTDLATVESSALRIRLGLMRIPSMQNPDDVKAMLQRLANTQHVFETAEEQPRGLEQANIAISQLDEVAQQNAALVEQSTAATPHEGNNPSRTNAFRAYRQITIYDSPCNDA